MVRRISSSKSVDNETAAQYGRFFCRQIMDLREHGFNKFFPMAHGALECCLILSSASFDPEHIFAADEVPFNFTDDGKTVSVRGSDAAKCRHFVERGEAVWNMCYGVQCCWAASSNLL